MRGGRSEARRSWLLGFEVRIASVDQGRPGSLENDKSPRWS